jgi:hypothetical protein
MSTEQLLALQTAEDAIQLLRRTLIGIEDQAVLMGNIRALTSSILSTRAYVINHRTENVQILAEAGESLAACWRKLLNSQIELLQTQLDLLGGPV